MFPIFDYADNGSLCKNGPVLVAYAFFFTSEEKNRDKVGLKLKNVSSENKAKTRAKKAHFGLKFFSVIQP